MGNLTTEQILAQRQTTHGEYSEHARCTQAVLRALQAERGWPTLSDMQKETLHMIAHKMGRVVTGNPDVADHWDDIAGYSRLISQRLENPVAPIQLNEDLYQALALAWNCSREEAVRRALAVTGQARAKEAATRVNVSAPDDISDREIDEAVKDIAQKLKPAQGQL